LTSSSGRCFIFCETKREVNNLNASIGIQKCKMLHGDIKQSDREKIYRGFKSGEIQIIIATNVAARGLDFPDVELVVQIEPPKQIESYIHRAGRTGRAGKSGTSVVLVQKRDMKRLRPI
jgi:ATP-dependent RNA helicase DDX21